MVIAASDSAQIPHARQKTARGAGCPPMGRWLFPGAFFISHLLLVIIRRPGCRQKGTSRRPSEGQYQVRGEASITGARRGELPDYLAAPSVAEEPTFSASQVLSGRVVRRKPATRSRAAAVSSQPSTGHSFQATSPL